MRKKRFSFGQASRLVVVHRCHAALRMIAALAVALSVTSTFQGPRALAQSQPVPIIQDVPSPPPASPAPQGAAIRRDPSQILGIRIESNGALITGPVNARRVYIPLDRPIIPEGMRGHWARSAEICALASEREEAAGQAVVKDNVLITDQEIVAKQRMRILQAFVPLPDTFTMAMLQSGRPLVLPARKHKRAAEVLVIFSTPGGERDYGEIGLLPGGQTIDFHSRSSRETAIRCASQRHRAP